MVTGRYYKDPTDARWDGDPGMIAWRAFMKTYYPEGSLIDSPNLAGYAQARTLVQVLKQCGDNLTRENVMKAGRQPEGLRHRRHPARDHDQYQSE